MTKQKFIYGEAVKLSNGKSIIDRKFQEPGFCDDCGNKFTPPLSKEMLEDQKQNMDKFYVRTSCDDCISKNHTLTDSELQGVKTNEN